MMNRTTIVGVAFCISLSRFLVGATWHVGPDGDFQKIQPAIDAAVNGDTIVVSPGSYVENIRFKGKNISLNSTDPLEPDVVAATIIDGNQAGSVVTFDGTENETCVLSGFRIRNGRGTIIPARYPPPDTICVGGGIIGGDPWGSYTRAAILNNIVTDNTASGQAAVGGGIANCDGLIANNIIARNTAVASLAAGSCGGGLSHCGGTVANNLIRENHATYGGGLSFCDGPIQNNSIAGNSAETDGGGLYFCDGTILNNTITSNSAGYGAGGLYICSGTIGNCIVWGNTAPYTPQFSHNGSTPTYSCIQNWTAGGIGNIALNPQFVDPDGPDNNPQTFGDNNYRLRCDSPCIDAGQNEDWMWTAFDLDGNARIIDGDDNGSDVVDMGAYEYSLIDITSPAITLLGANPLALEVGAPYSEPGYTATDERDGDISAEVTVTGSVNHTVVGVYTLRYNVTDSSGNPAEEKTRTVTVVDTTVPEITLLGHDPMALEVGTAYTEPGYTATDNYDGDITGSVVVSGSVTHTVLGDCTLTYNVSDSSGNPAVEKTRTVNVVDTTPPVITLLGDDQLTLECCTTYAEPGYTATDNYYGVLTTEVVVTGSVDHCVPDSYLLRYNVSDPSGNPAEEKTRTVNVVDTTPPVIVLEGDNPLTLEIGTSYEEPGYTGSDVCDGDLTQDVEVTGSVDHIVAGIYTLHYNVSDFSGNPAEQKTRTVNVVETAPFELLEVRIPTEGMVQLIWTSRQEDIYTVWSCSDLCAGQWAEEDTVASQGESSTWTDPDTTSICKFYRIELK